MEEQRKL